MEGRTLPKKTGLNPYSNGIYSMRNIKIMEKSVALNSLNPYSNGIYSMRVNANDELRGIAVLILILMEYTL